MLWDKQAVSRFAVAPLVLDWGAFFCQAEDGIRDGRVTGVQTCALPIFSTCAWRPGSPRRRICVPPSPPEEFSRRSEERRVGKECRSRGSPYHLKKKKESKHRLVFNKCRCDIRIRSGLTKKLR